MRTSKSPIHCQFGLGFLFLEENVSISNTVLTDILYLMLSPSTHPFTFHNQGLAQTKILEQSKVSKWYRQSQQID